MKYIILKDFDDTYCLLYSKKVAYIKDKHFFPSYRKLIEQLYIWKEDPNDSINISWYKDLCVRSICVVEVDTIQELRNLANSHPELLI